jgi:hypothetical protein
VRTPSLSNHLLPVPLAFITVLAVIRIISLIILMLIIDALLPLSQSSSAS